MPSSVPTLADSGLPQPCERMQESAMVWSSLGPSAADTPPPEEVNEEFFHLAEQRSDPLSPVSVAEPALVAVIGVGYVGLHLVTVFASRFAVLAYDVSKDRLDRLAREELADYTNVTLTADPSALSRATHFLVAVPTTLLPDKRVDTSFVRAALATVSAHARPGATVVIESSVGVGMTRKLLGNLMRQRNLKAGMSPERVDPGRTDPPVSAIPKLISGLDDITPSSLDSIHALYSAVFSHVVPVSSPEVAEMTKLYENCQRMVGIAYANEMADACAALGLDAFEVAAAAATKPFGYAPFSPGLGVGGHCIPVNPYYLLQNCEMPLLRSATERMWSRPAAVADRAMTELRAIKRQDGASPDARWWPRVLVVGLGFKPGQSVLSCSPGLAVVKHLLQEWDVYVAYADPLVAEKQVPFVPRLDADMDWTVKGLNTFDLIIVANRQHGLDFDVLARLPKSMVKWCCA